MQLGVHVRTLSSWEKKGKIQAIKTPSGQRRYNVESCSASKKESIKSAIICVRVVDEAQKLDFERKIATLIVTYPNIKVVSEAGESDEVVAEYRIQLVSNRHKYGRT